MKRLGLRRFRGSRSGLLAVFVAILIGVSGACSKNESRGHEHQSLLATVESREDLESIGIRDRVHIKYADSTLIDEVLSPRRLELLDVEYVELDQNSYTRFGLKRLATVSFKECQGLDHVEGAWLASFPALAYLSIDWCTATPEFYEALAQSPTLQVLRLRGPESIPVGCESSIAALASLTNLELDGMDSDGANSSKCVFGAAWDAALSDAKNLRMFEICRYRLEPGLEIKFVELQPKLHYFYSLDCSGASDRTFRGFIGHPNLSWASFSGVGGVSDEFVDELRESLGDDSHVSN